VYVIGTKEKKRVLVLDLDETLVHCKKEGPSSKCDQVIKIVLPDNQGTMLGMLNFRPHVFEFLKEMVKYYELVVYTASHECYASIVIDLLDPKSKYFFSLMIGEFFSAILCRDQCMQTDKSFLLKDMSIFNGRSLDEIMIVDNASYCFQMY
jgi:CTD small phosphatase-like protein 2